MMELRRRERDEEKEGKEEVNKKRKTAGMVLYLPLGESESSFNLEKAVCNHGFFMMAPNLWIPSSKTLQRPLRLADSTTCVTVCISHPQKQSSLNVLVLGANHSLSHQDQQVLLGQVARMLRISNKDESNMRDFHNIHSKAKKRGFGRLFRSPSLFEDMVKSILLCNCGWERTLKMAKSLCELQLALNGGSEIKGVVFYPNSLEAMRRASGDFPSSKELASLDKEILTDGCKLGYRASCILRLAQGVETGRIKLGKYKDDAKLYKKLMDIKGIGPFACANVLMCMGLYERVPADTETVRHLKEFHGRKYCTLGTVGKHVKEIYGKYAPFQCLAYWLELLESYEEKFGKLSQLPHSSYHIVTGSNKISIRKS